MIRIEQEPDRIPRGLVRIGSVLVVGIIILSVVATLLLGIGKNLGENVTVESRPPARFDTRPFELPTPWEIARSSSIQYLQSYGWADGAHRTIHVPIAVATELYLEEQHR